MEGIGVVAVLNEMVGHLLSLQTRTAEHDGIDARIVIYEALQCQVLVARMHHIIYVVDVLGTLVARPHHYLACVVEVAAGYALYLAAHRCREQQRGVLGGYAFEHGIDALREAHRQHLVGLVED